MYHLAIEGVEALARDVALEVVLGIEHGEPVGMRAVEGTHHLRHRNIVIQRGLGLDHQLRGREVMVEFDAEHHVAYLHDLNLTEEHPTSIEHRQHRGVTATDLLHNLSQFHVRRDMIEVALDHRV